MGKNINEIQEALARVKAFTFDIDGVATDGGLICYTNGDFIRIFDAKDGQAIRMGNLAGYTLGIITGGHSKSIQMRCKTCGIPVENIVLLANDKKKAFIKFCEDRNLAPEDVVYVGDDLPDIPVFEECGLAVCPADACPEVKEAADLIAPCKGGKGVFRYIIETALRVQGRWGLDVKQYAGFYDHIVDIYEQKD